MLSHVEARRKVIEVTRALRHEPERETAELARAFGRVLAQSIHADRDYPPFHRSTRDGFAVRAADAAAPGATLVCIGENKAGSAFSGSVAAGQCVEIMTGAAVPAGADAVVMVEHVTRLQEGQVKLERAAVQGQNIVLRGTEASSGQELLKAGTRLGVAEIAVAAQVGSAQVVVTARPRVAILSTGDEIVKYSETPGPLQIRNANGLALETLAALAGGEAISLGNAPDEREELRRLIEQGLAADLLVITGGVSKGKYDLVEEVLAELGVEIFFDAVAIRPGQPAVFGACRGKPVLGLPGNPISSIVTFELLAVPAIDVLSGVEPPFLPLVPARLTHSVQEQGRLTRFLPAEVRESGGQLEVSIVRWQGSGDLAALAHANAFLVVPAEKSAWAAGESAMVLLRRGFGGNWC